MIGEIIFKKDIIKNAYTFEMGPFNEETTFLKSYE